jgi:hypothetical protein
MRRAGSRSKCHKKNQRRKRIPRHVQERQNARIERELNHEVEKIFKGNLDDPVDDDWEYD